MMPKAVHICHLFGQSTHRTVSRVYRLHNQRTANRRGCRLRGIDRDRCAFGSDSKAESETRDEHVPPRIREALPDAGNGAKQTGDEDGATAAKVMVERCS